MPATLESDLALLGELHAQVMNESGDAGLVELIDALVVPEGKQEPADYGDLDAATAARLTRAVTVHLHLTNLADERHRSRSLRAEDAEFTGDLDAGDVWPAIAATGDAVEAQLHRLRLHLPLPLLRPLRAQASDRAPGGPDGTHQPHEEEA